ncbi:MAG TPA: EamA family transporter [Dissulfurispiraceae bacterium]
MGSLFKDWRSYIAMYVVCASLWSVMVKVAQRSIDSITVSFFSISTACVVVMLSTFRELQLTSRAGIISAVAGGLFSGLSSVAFYCALRRAALSTVIPLSSLYVVVAAGLSYFLFKETIAPKQILGIVFALVAVVLLAK